MKPIHVATASTLAIALVAGPLAAAPFEAETITDLNMRSGPGPDFEVVEVIPAETAVTVESCLEDQGWCRVSHAGASGWSYDQYLTVAPETVAVEDTSEAGVPADGPVVLAQRPGYLTIETTTFEREATEGEQAVGAGAGATLGALTAYALGGPAAGIIAGGIFGGAAGAEVTDEVQETVSYVRENPVETVYLDGEVVVGASVPETVTTYDLPVEGYEYLTVNRVPVIVDAQTGVIVETVR